MRILAGFAGNARFRDIARIRAVSDGIEPCAKIVGVVASHFASDVKRRSRAGHVGKGLFQLSYRPNRPAQAGLRSCRQPQQDYVPNGSHVQVLYQNFFAI